MHSEGRLASFGSKGKPEKINLVYENCEDKPHNANEQLANWAKDKTFIIQTKPSQTNQSKYFN